MSGPENPPSSGAQRNAVRRVVFCVFITALGAAGILRAGDLLRGGAAPNTAPTANQSSATSGAAAAAQAQSNAQDALARTARAIQSVQQLQNAARNAAAGASNLGADPNHPGSILPNVPDGLVPGGLQYVSGTGVSGAPTQGAGGNGVQVTVTQNTQTAILNWSSFNIGKNTTLYFNQSAGGAQVGTWVAFNQVNDPTGVPSQILGSIVAPGQVYVINQNGIIFGGTSQVNVHTLVASSLPINPNLISRGLLNNPDAQFLFSGLAQPAGTKGPTAAFTPPTPGPPNGRYGDVTVQPGAQLSSPTSADHVGGRIALVGANVNNAGTISTPDGQTILAAGLQVGFDASSDPSLRGLRTYVGAVADYAGTATNQGLITAERGDVTITGKSVKQLGAINSTTSVSFNGRVDLLANYNAVSNTQLDLITYPNVPPFLFQSAGSVEIGSGSAIQILPEWSNTDTVPGTTLALRSQINIQGQSVHLASGASILAPNGQVSVNAGVWSLVPSTTIDPFVYSNGQIYLDSGAMINVAGSTNVTAPLSEYIQTVTLRGAEVADSPLQRTSIFRPGNGTNPSITVDLRKTGTYNGLTWVGTPLANLTGYLGLVQRTVGELTVAGGSVSLNSGGSVVVQSGATIDVSGGYVNYQAGMVQTTRVIYANHIMDIADATPNRLYQGIFTGIFTESHPAWGITQNYTVPWMLGTHYEPAYISGANGGSLDITSAAVALDGDFLGNTINGPRQRKPAELAAPSEFSLTFQAQRQISNTIYPYSPSPPTVIIEDGSSQAPANPFALDSAGNPLPLRADRQNLVVLSPQLLTASGFGSITINNDDGNIIVPRQTSLTAPALGSITFAAANIDVEGSVTTPGGTVNFTAYNISPFVLPLLAVTSGPTPAPNPGRGLFTLGQSGTINTAGLIVDDRLSAPAPLSQPLVTNGGAVSIAAYSAELSKGGLIDVSGGVAIGATGKLAYGNGGSISIIAGSDPQSDTRAVLGGHLSLGATLRGFAGYSGAVGGSLTIQAPLIQVGGSTSDPNTLLLSPDFFSEGGFSSYNLTGIGAQGDVPGEYAPGVVIAPGTVIKPVAQSLVAVLNPLGSRTAEFKIILAPQGVRPPVSLSFQALGVTDRYTGNLVIRGDLVFGAGARIETDPLASVSLKGDTVDVLGTIIAPGGVITITGAGKFPTAGGNSPNAYPTVHIGPGVELSTAGTVLLQPDAFGRRTGTVLPGGTISVSGNIVAEAGATLDVSGTSGILDLSPAVLGQFSTPLVPLNSGLNTPLYSLFTVPTRVDSNGGTINLKGGQELFVDSKLVGNAGGPTALGGTLNVSSGRFYPPGTVSLPSDVNLVVTQSGPTLPAGFQGLGLPVLNAQGTPVTALGYFAANSFQSGGFDSLSLGGNVQFKGPVTIDARGTLTVASGGIIQADSNVVLKAAYAKLGQPFLLPANPSDSPVYPFPGGSGELPVSPTFGPGSLTVIASLIDVGNLSLQNIGKASLIADGGDIRGSGTLGIAGSLYLRAGQIYPTTAGFFNIIAYDYTNGGNAMPGSATIAGSGDRSLPLSAGGVLSIYATNIVQGGVLRAPLGTINLGWDGTGTGPVDPISTLTVPVTKQLTLTSGSVTSVSAVDPGTGKALTIPYGISLDGLTWLAPNGLDITAVGTPSKGINLGASNITTQPGSTLDISGGGDVFAFQFVPGNGGSRDILASSTSFAVIPGYQANFSPYAPFNATAGDAGYVNNNLKVGDQVYLGGSPSLPAGTYTLLPARYALLPGAVLVTPESGTPVGTVNLPDGSSIVAGYRYNSLNDSRTVPTLVQRFEVAPASLVNARAQYDTFLGNEFFAAASQKLNQATPRLPVDAGTLVFQATQSLTLSGSVLAGAPDGGLHGLVDISSPTDIYITGAGGSAPSGALKLDAGVLNSWDAESILIGGVRTFSTEGTTLAIRTNNITVNNSGTPLSAPEIILASNQTLTLDPGAQIIQSGSMGESAALLLLGDSTVPGSGNGTLLRVSSDPLAQIARSGVTQPNNANMIIGAGALISGTSITLDSTYGTTLSPLATLTGGTINLNSGQISLQLDSSVPVTHNTVGGLVLAGPALQSLQSAQSLSLLSYTALDIYGGGQMGSSSFADLSLHAAEIRGYFGPGGTVTVDSSATNSRTVTVTSVPSGLVVGSSLLGSTVESISGTTITLAANANVTLTNASTSFKGGTATIAARNISIDNSLSGTDPGPTDSPSGTLVINANVITLGADQVAIDQYSALNMNASGGLITTGSGSLEVQGPLTVTAPLVTGAAASTYAITSTGALTLQAPAGNPAATVIPALGASLILQGATVSAGTPITLPSGLLTVHATTGDLTVTGALNAGGTAQTFYDLVRYTDGGQVSLTSDHGLVDITNTGTVNVSAQPGGGNAGTVSISAPTALLEINGQLYGQAGQGGASGTLQIDAGHLPGGQLSSITPALNGFNLSRTVRDRLDATVTLDGSRTVQSFTLSADAGSIDVTGTVNASGQTGGSIFLSAFGSVTLENHSVLTVAAQTFNDAGKGGSVDIEAGSEINGVINSSALLNILTGSTIDLSVASNNTSSASFGDFTGTLHLRAPQNSTATDLQIGTIYGSILNASSITIEGYKLYQPVGGAIDAVKSLVQTNGNTFASDATTAAMVTRVLNNGGNAALSSVTSFVPGAEIINLNSVQNPLAISLATSGATLSVNSGVPVLFTSGTPGSDMIQTNAAATITLAGGGTVALAANTPTMLAAGSSVTLSANGILTFASGSSALPVTLPADAIYTTSGSVSIPVSTVASNIQLVNTASKVTVPVGTAIAFPVGTPGSDRITSSKAGTITKPDGTTTALSANVATALVAGSTITLNGSGTGILSFTTNTSGGVIPVTLPGSASYTTAGSINISTLTGDLTLGTLNSPGGTASGSTDWNFASYRFGATKQVPGILTLRAAGNITLFSSLSDGFNTSAYNSTLLAYNSQLPANAQSWSFRLVAGADLGGANYQDLQPLANLASSSGSVQLGKNIGTAAASTPGAAASTSLTINPTGAGNPSRYQVIRTGTGDIGVFAGRDVQLLNQFATIYTAGVIIDPTMGGNFDVPAQNLIGTSTGTLGSVQQSPPYAAQYTMAGGNVIISAQNDIIHLTKDVFGNLIDDSEREMPVNWLYRRGYVDPVTGQFGASYYGDIASTSWWVDFSNFFEGVGALGGGNVSLIAGRDVKNVDAVIPTNGRMPKGTPDASKLVELGGGDLTVQAGRDINGGVYYVERGNGTLNAGGSITTNSTRSPSQTILSGEAPYPSSTWLPTTLFLGKGTFDVNARQDLLLGPVVNPFLLPQGYNNTFLYKTYFSTYGADDSVNVTSLSGSVTFRESDTLPNTTGAVPILQAWFQNELYFSSAMTVTTASASYFQPWLRLSESDLTAFPTVFGLMPPTLNATAFSGDVNLAGPLTLFPSPTGTINLLAAGAINGLQVVGQTSTSATSFAASQINLSDADPSSVPGLSAPFAYQSVIGLNASAANTTPISLLASVNQLFTETGSTTGAAAVSQTKQSLHAAGLLHANDTTPISIYARDGDISGFSLFAGKPAQIFASQDIADVSLYIQNNNANEVTVISAGRDIIPYDSNTTARIAMLASNPYLGGPSPQVGDIQINGPGTLEVLAGRNLDLGSAPSNADGTGAGITSIGNGRNPYLPFDGASIIAGAGVGGAGALGSGNLDFTNFISQFVTGGDGARYLSELSQTTGTTGTILDTSSFSSLPVQEQNRIALDVFFLALRDAGRDHNLAGTPGFGNYNAGTAAIAALFPGSAPGDITTRSRDIRTKSGGSIDLFAPGGGLSLQTVSLGGTLTPPGIITEHGGNINIFTNNSVNLGISRIFTLRGGDIVIWSSTGDIAAGSSAKTVASAPPTRVIIDPQSGDVQVDLAGLATGGGIGVLATVAGIPPGNVDLIAPLGVVDAGDAGIRATGNLNIAATAVLNASNIAVTGASLGTPSAPTVSAPNIGGISAGNQAAGASTAAATSVAQNASRPDAVPVEDPPSIITVEVLGYGGGDE